MNEEIRVHPEDAMQEPYTATRAEVLDSEGRLLGFLPAGLTHEQFHVCLKFANEFWSKGVKFGRECQKEDVLKALGLKQ